MKQQTKSDRALELFERGLTSSQIADRLGTKPKAISSLLHCARAKREREAELQRAGVIADVGANV